MLVVAACSTSTEPAAPRSAAQTAEAGDEEVFSSADLAAAEKSLAEQDARMEDWIAGVVRCAHEKGWEGVEAMTGGFSFDSVPRDQQLALKEDLGVCEKAAGPAPNDEPPSRAEVAVVYHRWIDAKSCLEGLGYEISDPPSLNVYIEDYLHSENGPWSPFVDLPRSADLSQVKQTCPE